MFKTITAVAIAAAFGTAAFAPAPAAAMLSTYLAVVIIAAVGKEAGDKFCRHRTGSVSP